MWRLKINKLNYIFNFNYKNYNFIDQIIIALSYIQAIIITNITYFKFF